MMILSIFNNFSKQILFLAGKNVHSASNGLRDDRLYFSKTQLALLSGVGTPLRSGMNEI